MRPPAQTWSWYSNTEFACQAQLQYLKSLLHLTLCHSAVQPFCAQGSLHSRGTSSHIHHQMSGQIIPEGSWGEWKGYSIVSDTLLDRCPSSFISWPNNSKPCEKLDTKPWHLTDVNHQLWPYLMWGGLALPGRIWDCLPVTVQKCAALGNSRDWGKRLLRETAW